MIYKLWICLAIKFHWGVLLPNGVLGLFLKNFIVLQELNLFYLLSYTHKVRKLTVYFTTFLFQYSFEDKSYFCHEYSDDMQILALFCLTELNVVNIRTRFSLLKTLVLTFPV